MKQIILFFITVYQRVFSPDSGIPHLIFPWLRVCRFQPTCSRYMYEAISRYGIIDGLRIGIKRVLRCHPWHRGGFDPVP